MSYRCDIEGNAMDIDNLKTDAALRAEIASDEGIRSTPYKDSRGNWTGGIGHNLGAHGIPWSDIAKWLKAGIPDETIMAWFSEDIEAAITCCEQVFDGFDDLPDQAQRVLTNMAFDLMYGLWKWPKLRAEVARSNWKGAASSILQSRFATEAPNRCRRLAYRLEGIP
jgi:GH24 family phage-related lysozyme (muramidase)